MAGRTIFRTQGSTFAWDDGKARVNLEKHGVSFDEAAEAFLDPMCVFGDATVGVERRDFVIGYSVRQRLLLVVHVERSEHIRIVSARQATRTERKLYEEA